MDKKKIEQQLGIFVYKISFWNKLLTSGSYLTRQIMKVKVYFSALGPYRVHNFYPKAVLLRKNYKNIPK